MKAVCTRKCFIRVGKGKARLFKPGEVHDFEDVPESYFRIIEGQKAEKTEDFSSASEEELLEGPYTITELREYAEKNYDVKLKGRSKAEVVSSFVDARFRYLEEHELEGVV